MSAFCCLHCHPSSAPCHPRTHLGGISWANLPWRTSHQFQQRTSSYARRWSCFRGTSWFSSIDSLISDSLSNILTFRSLSLQLSSYTSPSSWCGLPSTFDILSALLCHGKVALQNFIISRFSLKWIPFQGNSARMGRYSVTSLTQAPSSLEKRLVGRLLSGSACYAACLGAFQLLDGQCTSRWLCPLSLPSSSSFEL